MQTETRERRPPSWVPPRHGVMCQIQERRPGRPFHQGCWMACPSLLFPVLLLFSVKPIFRQSPNAAGLGWIRCLSTSFSFLCLFLSILQPLWVSFLVLLGWISFLVFSPLSLFFSLFLLFLCLSFVKPSSFKIIEWWFFG